MRIIGQSPLVGLTPWFIYWLAAGCSATWVCGGLCALLAAVLLGVSIGCGRPKALAVLTLVFFVAVTIAGTVVGAAERNWLDAYAMPVSSGVLALTILASLFIAPATEPYIRVSAARLVWREPPFESTDRSLTILWFLVFTNIAALGLVSATTLSMSNWITCLISLAVILTALRVTRHARESGAAVSTPRHEVHSLIRRRLRLQLRTDLKPVGQSATRLLGRSYAAEPSGRGAVEPAEAGVAERLD